MLGLNNDHLAKHLAHMHSLYFYPFSLKFLTYSYGLTLLNARSSFISNQKLLSSQDDPGLVSIGLVTLEVLGYGGDYEEDLVVAVRDLDHH